MKYVLILSAIILSGCTTAPVVARFPGPPGMLATQACGELKQLNDSAKLSDVAKTVTENYTSYHECAIKLEAWHQWYAEQKLIFEQLK